MPASERSWSAMAAPDEDGGGFTGLAVEAMLGKLDTLAEGMAKPRHPRIPWEACHPVWFTGAVPLTAGAGTLVNSNLYGPEGPYWWDLRSVSVWGFTAGTVTLYRNTNLGELLAVTNAPGEFTWSAQVFLSPQDGLVWGATGITGSVFVTGQAIELQTAWLPEYLM